MSFGIPEEIFYGNPTVKQLELISKLDQVSKLSPLSYDLPYRLKRPFGPSKCWKIFKKQDEALIFQKKAFNPLMTFAFQQSLGERLFLVAHPAIFWFYDSKRCPTERASYEVIPENSVCKLYFDLEFDKEINPKHDGTEMTNIFIQIVNQHLLTKWNIQIKNENILNLDSSSPQKFSKHLIYQIPNAIFKDNYNVGYFVKRLCKEMNNFFLSNQDFYCNISKEDISKLFIQDKKNNIRIFCDEGVYTKNRHFRLLGSSKLGKNSSLIVASENKYHPEYKDKRIPCDEQMFLDSLITFIENSEQQILHVEPFERQQIPSKSDTCDLKSDYSTTPSPFPQIDHFICSIIEDGKIYRWHYFSSENLLVYDIIRYRFCGNIGRKHRSNNIKYIVNIVKGIYYQKCYDPECSTYRSPDFNLPEELKFLIEDDSWLMECLEDSDEKLNKLGSFKFDALTPQENKDQMSSLKASFGIVDDNEFIEMLDAIEVVEQMDITNFD